MFFGMAIVKKKSKVKKLKIKQPDKTNNREQL